MKLGFFAIVSAVGIFSVGPSLAGTLFQDNFDSYPVGSFPPGWTSLWGGAGNAYQIVDNSRSLSKPNSLMLVGSSCWAEGAFHSVAFPPPKQGRPDIVIAKTAVNVGELGINGCGPDTAYVTLRDPSLGPWGTDFAGVVFDDDNYIYDVNGSKLVPFKLNRWYSVTITADFSAQTYSIKINGMTLEANVNFPTAGLPTGIFLSASHGTTPVAWFDNVTILH